MVGLSWIGLVGLEWAAVLGRGWLPGRKVVDRLAGWQAVGWLAARTAAGWLAGMLSGNLTFQRVGGLTRGGARPKLEEVCVPFVFNTCLHQPLNSREGG